MSFHRTCSASARLRSFGLVSRASQAHNLWMCNAIQQQNCWVCCYFCAHVKQLAYSMRLLKMLLVRQTDRARETWFWFVFSLLKFYNSILSTHSNGKRQLTSGKYVCTTYSFIETSCCSSIFQPREKSQQRRDLWSVEVFFLLNRHLLQLSKGKPKLKKKSQFFFILLYS